MATSLPSYAPWSENMGPLKVWVLESHEKIVDALYSIDHLLDRLLSNFVLTNENYNEVRAETIPTKKARKLLEIVRLQFSEEQVEVFVECLMNSQSVYPKLRTLLFHRPRPGDKRYVNTEVKSFPTVEKLRRQSSELCHRLGDLTVPITVQLFAQEMLGQVEKEHVENASTPFDRSKKLIDVCLRRGEPACCLFYKALRHEDPNLAGEMGAYDVENVTSISVETTGETTQPLLASEVPVSVQTPVITAFPETGVQGDSMWPSREKSTDEPRTLASTREFNPATANSGSCGFDSVFSDSLMIESVGGESVTLMVTEKGLVKEVMSMLGVEEGSATRVEYDILGLSEMLGLRREHAWEMLQEAGGWDLRRQVTAIVATFLEVTGGDVQRLRNKLQQCDPSWFLVSKRGVCLLDLISQSCETFLSAADGVGSARDAPGLLVVALHDCALSTAPADNSLPYASPAAFTRSLECIAAVVPFYREEVGDLLGDLEGPDSSGALERVTALAAQLVRELFRAGAEEGAGGQYRLHALPQHSGRTYACTLHSPWSVTGFPGLQPWLVKKLHAEQQQCQTYDELHSFLYKILERIARSLAVDFPSNDGAVSIGSLLCGNSASPFYRRIHARLAARLRWSLESDSGDRRRCVLAMHRRTLADLLDYVRRSERHSFTFRVERVVMLGQSGPALCGVRSAGPLAQIDGAMEETLAFLTSEPAAFVASVRCEFARNGEVQECSEPATCRVTFPRATSIRASSLTSSFTSPAAAALPARRVDLTRNVASGEVVAECADAVWIRAREGVAFESLVADVRAAVAASPESGSIDEAGFCFRVEAHERESRVRLVFDGNRIHVESVGGAAVKT